ncbi:MAG: IS200/IS605 family transposase [Muribaculaceae bacterium]|nr:IS200/IS605 family transposase [Muribaculaceae bacterium]
MANTYVKNIIHIVFHIKSKTSPILADDLNRVFKYIGGITKGIGGTLIEIGGMPDHIHLLTALPKTMALSDFVKTIKANSSRWIKELNPYYIGFSWQDGYGAFSVSATVVPKVINYIRNQEKHHKQQAFIDEYKSFLIAYGIDYDERYL